MITRQLMTLRRLLMLGHGVAAVVAFNATSAFRFYLGGPTAEWSVGDLMQFNAQNGGASGDLLRTIEAKGETINGGHAIGGYAIESYSATVP